MLGRSRRDTLGRVSSTILSLHGQQGDPIFSAVFPFYQNLCSGCLMIACLCASAGLQELKQEICRQPSSGLEAMLMHGSELPLWEATPGSKPLHL